MKRILLTAVTIYFGLITSLYPQDSLSSRAFKLLNDELKNYEMNLNDIWLPIDTAENNYHRLKIFDTLFSNPLRSVDLVKYHATELLNLNEKTFDSYFTKVFDQLEFRKYQPVYYENNLTTKEIDYQLGFGTDTTLGNEGGQLFRMFISPVIQIKQLLADDFLCKNSARLTFLKDNYMKVLLGSLSEDSNIGFDSLQKIAKDFFIYSQSANRSLMYSNGISLYATLLKLSQIAKNNIDILKNSIKTTIIETPYGRIALGGAGNDRYEGDFTAILDIGGDDKYNISSSENGNGSPANFLIDLSGSDTFSGNDYTLGGTSFGINVLIDLEGDDEHWSENFTFGCGAFGVGILHDLSGDDRYQSMMMSQGASAFGIGMLIDNAGNDNYYQIGLSLDKDGKLILKEKTFGQGIALPKGFGVLCDNYGKDYYYTDTPFHPMDISDSLPYISFSQGASVGFYPYASGGIGLLIDGRGNDRYTSGICSQGFGYWFGLGGLYDYNGFDLYKTYQFGQGSAINSGIGILLDDQGNDFYESEGMSQGFANENSFGLLLDDFGNDSYSVYNQPDTNINISLPSYSFLVDVSSSCTFGNYIIINKKDLDNEGILSRFFKEKFDTSNVYSSIAAMPEGNPAHTMREKYGFFNFLLTDTSIHSNRLLRDQYRDENKFVIYNLSQFDFERKLIFSHSKKDTNPSPEFWKNMAAEELYHRVMSLNISIEELDLFKNKIAENPPSIQFLAGRLSTESLFERNIIDDVLSALLKKGSLPVKNLLIDSCESKDYHTIKICMDLMSEFKIYDIVKRISEVHKSNSWMLRAEAAKSIGIIGANPQIDILLALIEDSHPYVRAAAVYSLGRLMPEDVLNRIHLCFYDDFLFVRNKVFEGLTDNRQLSLLFIEQVLQSDLPMSVKGKFAALITGSKYTKKEMKIFQEKFNNLPVNLRKIIYKSIYNSGNKSWNKKLKDFRKNESEPELQNLIDRIFASWKKERKINFLICCNKQKI